MNNEDKVNTELKDNQSEKIRIPDIIFEDREKYVHNKPSDYEYRYNPYEAKLFAIADYLLKRYNVLLDAANGDLIFHFSEDEIAKNLPKSYQAYNRKTRGKKMKAVYLDGDTAFSVIGRLLEVNKIMAMPTAYDMMGLMSIIKNKVEIFM